MSEMKTVLVLGCGLVAPPLIHYLHEHGYKLIVANRTVSRAEAVIKTLKNARAVEFDVDAPDAFEKLDKITQECDLVVSLLPYLYHVQAAKIALKYQKHFCTTSYVSEEMKKLDEEAQKAGVVLLNECGVDPGLDHMSAKKIIDEVHAHGGKLMSFFSICGGLPAPQSNNNPLGYKLSWSPRGVLLAGRNNATFLVDGDKVAVPGVRLYDPDVYRVDEVEGVGKLEWYPNRDSTAYVDIYSVPEVQTIIRGTYRNAGWCEFLKAIATFGFNSTDVISIGGKTCAEFASQVLGDANSAPKQFIADKLQIALDHPIMQKFEFLGLFSSELRVPEKVNTALDALCFLFERSLQYAHGEKDMIVMRHTFEVEYSLSHRETLQSTLIDQGLQPDGYSSMARTVTLPVAAAIRAILDGRMKAKGLMRPVEPEIYNLVLAEMEELKIHFQEEKLAPLLWVRAETKPGEERVIVTPEDAAKLLAAGYRVVVERSAVRAIPDAEYAAVGCKLAATGSWVTAPPSAIILALKELPESDAALRHRHVFFAHCFKYQAGWKELLARFNKGGGLLWDLEFLNDDQGRRVAAFGRSAGMVGMAVGLLAWAHQQLGLPVKALTSWKSTAAMIDGVKDLLKRACEKTGKPMPTTIVIGALGRCGQGAVWVAEQCGVATTKWDLAETRVGGPFPQILEHDVFANCIYLSPGSQMPPFITKDMLAGPRKLSVITDVSCDPNNPSNPIPVYSRITTLADPVLRVTEEGKAALPVDVVAIDHLPSLLPVDSSRDFSSAITPHLLALKDAYKEPVWARAEKLFVEKVKEASQ